MEILVAVALEDILRNMSTENLKEFTLKATHELELRIHSPETFED